MGSTSVSENNLKRLTLLLLTVSSLFVTGLSLSPEASADPRTQYGWGLHDLATAGADRTGSDDGMTVVQNPAAMTNQAGASWAANLTGMAFQFPDLNGVVTDSPNVGGTAVLNGNVAVNPDPLFMFQFGLQSPFGIDKKWRFGFSFSIPVDRAVDVSTLNGYQPAMAFYGKPEARLTSVVGIARQLSDNFSLGIAGDLYFKTGASLNARLPAAPTTSTLSFGATVKLAVAPQAGLNFQPTKGFDLTVDYLGARDYRQEVSASNAIYLVAGGNAGLVQLATTGSVYYDSETYSLGAKFDLAPEAKIKVLSFCWVLITSDGPPMTGPSQRLRLTRSRRSLFRTQAGFRFATFLFHASES